MVLLAPLAAAVVATALLDPLHSWLDYFHSSGRANSFYGHLTEAETLKKGSSLFLDVMSWNDALNPLSLVLRVFVVFFFP